VSTEGVSVTTSDATESFKWAEVNGVRYWAMAAGKAGFQGLDFSLADNRKLDLRITDPEPRVVDADDLSYMKMLVACLRELATQRPDLSVEIGNKKSVQWALFLIGVVCIGFALALVFFALAEGRNSRLEAALLPIGMMMLFGGAIAWNFHPFSPPVMLESDAILRMLEPPPEEGDQDQTA